MFASIIFAATFVIAATTAVAGPGEPTVPPMNIEEVTFQSGDIQLAGRLWLPDAEGPHPAVIFIPGSGRSIRNLDLDPDPVPFHMVVAGLAMLAWDKRGVRDSGGEFEPLSDDDPDEQVSRLRLLAEDAGAAMRYLAARDDIDADRIGVLAFSQGGWVASQLHAAGVEPRFIIVVGGPAVSIGEELRYSEIADEAKKASRDGKGPVDLDKIYDLLEAIRPANGDFGGYDPYPHLEATQAPTLFLLGEFDLSVPTRCSVARLEKLGRHHEWIDYVVFARANHGVATTDAAGTWYAAENFYQTQFEFLENLGILERRLRPEFTTGITKDKG